MAKRLSEMTMEELWHLFPISLVPHDDRWETWYREEVAEISRLLKPLSCFELHHIGSTAVPRIYAKNIVDILGVCVASSGNFSHGGMLYGMDALRKASEILCDNGWICMNESENCLSLNKGYTENGFADRVFHLHLRLAGDDDEIAFRDYLIAHPAVAKEYESLKLSLWKQHEFNRDAYTDAKTDFVQNVVRMAKMG